MTQVMESPFAQKAAVCEKDLPLAVLKDLLIYHPDEGNFYWRKSSKYVLAGAKAGSVKSYGVVISIHYRGYHTLPLAWYYMTGKWPLQRVVPKNGDVTDSRWGNLTFAPVAPLRPFREASPMKI